MDALDLSELVKNWATSLGVALGGAWAFWKWGYSEWLDTKKNRASLDGSLNARAETLSSGLLLVTLLAKWNNRGHFSVPVDPKASRVLVYRLPEALPLGPIDPDKDLGEPMFVQKPFAELDGLELEPKTESSLRAHFVLEPGSRYLFRWEMYKPIAQGDKLRFSWSKEIVWNPSSNRTLDSDARLEPRAG